MMRPDPGRRPATVRRPSRRRAFTLVELIAAIVVVAALGSGASLILLTAIDGYVEAGTRAQLHAEASMAMDRIIRELRKIPGDPPGSSGAPAIDSLSATAVTWSTDSSFALNGTVLEFVDAGAAAVDLLTDVTGFTLAASDESDAALALPLAGAGCDAIRRLTVSITLEREGVSETLSAKVFLRCAMAGGG